MKTKHENENEGDSVFFFISRAVRVFFVISFFQFHSRFISFSQSYWVIRFHEVFKWKLHRKGIDKRLNHVRADVHVQMLNIISKLMTDKRKIWKNLEFFLLITLVAATTAYIKWIVYKKKFFWMECFMISVVYSSIGSFHFTEVLVFSFCFVCYLLSSRYFVAVRLFRPCWAQLWHVKFNKTDCTV